MAKVTVWTEIQPTAAIYRDCCWCAILMVLVGGGNTKWPLGAYTHLERRAFRNSDPRDNFAGPVERAHERYGATIHSPTPLGKEQLRAALNTAGKAWAIAGRLANFPAGHPLRRWDPTFTGFHAIAYVPAGNGAGTWFDPLAPMGYAGQTVTVSQVVDTFCTGNYPNDARYLALDELSENDGVTEVTISLFPDGPHTCTIPAGGTVDGWDLDGKQKSQVWPNGSTFPADATVVIKQTPQKAPNGTFRRATAGLYAGLYVPVSQVALGPAINPPPSPTDAANAVAEAAAAEAAKF